MSEQGLSLRFRVTIDHGISLGDWSTCDGLTVEYDVQEYQEGGNNDFVHRLPGRRKYTNIRLSRPIDASTAQVMGWLASVQARVSPSTAHISVLDTNDETVASWTVVGVYPAKWSGPTLDLGSNRAAMETLELVHNGFLGAPGA
jgi:phage tail-like protein